MRPWTAPSDWLSQMASSTCAETTGRRVAAILWPPEHAISMRPSGQHNNPSTARISTLGCVRLVVHDVKELSHWCLAICRVVDGSLRLNDEASVGYESAGRAVR